MHLLWASGFYSLKTTDLMKDMNLIPPKMYIFIIFYKIIGGTGNPPNAIHGYLTFRLCLRI